MAAIEVIDLSFGYGRHAVLHSVSLEIREGTFHVLLGRNGSGKSTLVRVLAGMTPYRQGLVRVMGTQLNDLSPSRRAKIVGYLPQRHHVVFPFSVEDVVLTGRAAFVRYLPGKEDHAKVAEILERLGIAHLRHRPFPELSGGEQQIVQIARVLAQEPRIILLDEPTSHLDVSNQTLLLELLRDVLDWGLTVVAVLHDPNVAFLFGDAFTCLRDGRVLEPDPGQDVRDPTFLKKLYGVEMMAISFEEKTFVLPVLRAR